MNSLFERKASIALIDNFNLISNENSIYTHADNLNKREIYKKLVMSAIKTQLNEAQRTTLQLYYFEKLTVYEIGEKLNITPSAVSKRLKIAKNKIYNFADACIDMGLFKNY